MQEPGRQSKFYGLLVHDTSDRGNRSPQFSTIGFTVDKLICLETIHHKVRGLASGNCNWNWICAHDMAWYEKVCS